ncbi:2-keto-4-pentenoate hydratase [Secundilactobacillus folii]|uniref:2-keto-4-pentenoate hydratase n=1 Tax=Secundilactobacillus folii TaxID=2678357 RepID=A0A7X2XU96_9LACO|nr:2-keto-4-pentenoate hydratase [Secundilactobacillus folii]MTV81788.1 2-keto-4-pentenoate hydratase [Secundilactobacillus folii]
MSEQVLSKQALSDKEAKLAQALFDAYTSHKPLKEDDFKGYVDTEDAAYRVQRQLTADKKETVGGYKVSLTSKQTQDMFDSDSPLYGAQVKSHFVTSPHTVEASDVMDPLAEVEMMFCAKEDLSANDSLEDLWHKTTVAPAVEVPDSRFSDWFPSLSKYMVMADAAVGGYVVYGEGLDADKLFESPEDLATVKCELFHDGKKLKDGAATEVLGNPLNSLQWLVKKLDSQGMPLRKGQRVSAGTFLLPESLTKGDWKATFDKGMGAVLLHVNR